MFETFSKTFNNSDKLSLYETFISKLSFDFAIVIKSHTIFNNLDKNAVSKQLKFSFCKIALIIFNIEIKFVPFKKKFLKF